MTRNRFGRTGTALFVLVAIGVAAAGSGGVQADGPGLPGPIGNLDGVYLMPVQGNIYMLVGAGANITVSAGRKDGIMLVDSGEATHSDAVLALLRQLAEQLGIVKPLRYIINTGPRPDHTWGNARVASSGRSYTGGLVVSDLSDAGMGAAIIAHERVLLRLTADRGDGQPAPFAALPTETYYMESMKLSHFFNDEGVRIDHLPAATTDGDSLVYFRRSDVISTGDVFVTTSYPVIDVDRGGSIQGVVDALNRILDLAIPESSLTEGGTMIIPGHGRLGDAADVAYYRDMVTIIRDRVQHSIDEGLTLDQVKATRPTKDYDTRYGMTPDWTPDMFIEAVYRSLSTR